VSTDSKGGVVLEVTDLRVRFRLPSRSLEAVRGVSFKVSEGEVLGIAGESGSGKSVSVMSVLGLLPPSSEVHGSIKYRGQELVGLTERAFRKMKIRGRKIAMVFQETTTALNPIVPVGSQLRSAARANLSSSGEDVDDRIVSALRDVQLTNVDRVLRSYPHQLSGGMAQRVMLAMALSCGPEVLIADEPTTALDVSVQQEILALIEQIVEKRQLAVIMISHDLAVLNEVCQNLMVMYAGEVLESGPIGQVLSEPRHPYTIGLLDSLPRLGDRVARYTTISGTISDRGSSGECAFRPRCSLAMPQCQVRPDMEYVGDEGGAVRCWRHAEARSILTEPDSSGGQIAKLESLRSHLKDASPSEVTSP
jgi:oligopeptide/dipeptide ABC transporter ATP-binding protein